MTATARTTYGWTAEIAIPFAILNFPRDVDTIGIDFLRYHHRTTEWSRWADVTVRSLPEEMGRLAGLRPAPGGKAKPWTFLPYALLGRNIPDRSGEVRDRLATAGADIRYEPRPNLTSVLSLRPDFSQVERAVTSVDFSYNEKFRSDLRPFFQEGAAYFSDAVGDAATGQRYFYSSRVPDFDVGLKAFGRAGRYAFGALATRGPDGRSDLVASLNRQFSATHQAAAMIVATRRPDLRNELYVLRGAGRLPSGLSYSFDAAATRTDDVAVRGGSHARGLLGWERGYWSVGATLDRYSRDFFPADGLLARDLPDTAGGRAFISYYRDRSEGMLREVRGDLSWQERTTSGGMLQRRDVYASASVELRELQLRLGAAAKAGPYRPVGSIAGEWSATVNDDRYGTVSADFNTRSSRLGYGAARSSGWLGGGDYRYSIAYLWIRPVPTLAFSASTEVLTNFGTFRQAVLAGSWDLTPGHTVAGRYVAATGGDSHRLTYTWRARRDLEFFAVYDHASAMRTQLSVKVLATY